MDRLKWFDRFLTNEIVEHNRFLSCRQRKNRFLRPIQEITSAMSYAPGLTVYIPRFQGITSLQPSDLHSMNPSPQEGGEEKEISAGIFKRVVFSLKTSRKHMFSNTHVFNKR